MVNGKGEMAPNKVARRGGFEKWLRITRQEALDAGIEIGEVNPACLDETYDRERWGVRIDGRPYVWPRLS